MCYICFLHILHLTHGHLVQANTVSFTNHQSELNPSSELYPHYPTLPLPSIADFLGTCGALNILESCWDLQRCITALNQKQRFRGFVVLCLARLKGYFRGIAIKLVKHTCVNIPVTSDWQANEVGEISFFKDHVPPNMLSIFYFLANLSKLWSDRFFLLKVD